MFDLTEFFILLIIATIANGLSAIAGGGAGLLQLPILLFLGLPFSSALATHKIASVALGVGSTARYWKEKIVELRFSLFVVAFGLPGVIIGALTILAIDERLATFLLGLLTLGLGVYSFFKSSLGQDHLPIRRDLKGFTIGGVVIFIIGFLNGSLTSGTGLFMTMWLVYWFGLDYKRAVATTMILVGFFWNASGAVTLSLATDVKWIWLPPLLIGSLVGSYLGAHLAISKGNTLIKRLFEVLTIGVGISLLIKVF